MKTQVTNEMRAEMRRLRRERLNIAEIALRVGCGREAARNAVAGVLPPRGREFEADELALLIRLHQEMRTRNEIAASLGKSRDQIKHMLKKLELSRRSQWMSEEQIAQTVALATAPNPPEPKAPSANLVVQALRDEKSAWECAAKSEGLNLSEWVRKTLNAAIK